MVDAVLAEQAANPLGAWRAAQELSAWVSPPGLEHHPARLRALRAHHPRPEGALRCPARGCSSTPAKRSSTLALLAGEAAPRRPGSVDDFFAAFLPIIPVINRFFEAVLVMAEDPAVRANRLGLLQRVAALAKGVADFSVLEGF